MIAVGSGKEFIHGVKKERYFNSDNTGSWK